jgi:hypothetical protein
LREYLYEITRGLYNNIINKIGKTKKEKELVIEIVGKHLIIIHGDIG